MHTKTALIDGDIIVYAVGFAANTEPLANALNSVKLMIRDIIDSTRADSYKIFLTGKENYRVELATIKPYKGTRRAEKPVHYNAIREYMIKHWDAEVIDGKEADDQLGIEQTKSPDTTIICTIDKDLDMIAGRHYNWRKKSLYEVSQAQADVWFMKQLLMGDSADNIPGLAGIGDKKAQRVIDDAKNMTDLYWTILEMYSLQYERPFEAMMENANLLWIQRKEDVLWNPLLAEFANEKSEERPEESKVA